MTNEFNVPFYDKSYCHILIILSYIIALTTILEYNSIYSKLAGIGNIVTFIINFVWYLSIFGICVSSFHYIKKTYVHNLVIFSIMFVLISSLFLIPYYVNFRFSPVIFIKLVITPVLLAICFCNHYFVSIFFHNLVKIMTYLSLLSIVLWVLSILGLGINTTIPIKFGSTVSVHPALFFVQFFEHYTFFGMDVIRNTGMFVEAPMYSYIITMTLFIHLFLCNKKNRKLFDLPTIILLIANLTTFSTTGIIFSLLVLLYVFIEDNSSKSYVLLIIPFLIIAIFVIKLVFIEKTQLGSQDPLSSYNVRSDDIHASLLAWKTHPLFGCGINNNEYIVQFMNPNRILPGTYTLGVTTGLFSILAYGGLLLFIYYILPILLPLFTKNMNVFGIILFSSLILISVYGQYSFIYIIVLSYTWSDFVRSCGR